MNIDLILIEIVLWTIAIMSGLIAYEFYKSRDGRLRVLIISLFLCKVYLYGGSAVWFLFSSAGNWTLVRALLFNVPMFIIMLRLWGYIRTHNK